MNRKTLWITETAVLLALLVGLQFVTKAMGQFVTGSCVNLVLGVAVAQMAMPAAVNGTMLCLEFNGDADAMAQVTFLTTVLSIVTIPLAVSLFV